MYGKKTTTTVTKKANKRPYGKANKVVKKTMNMPVNKLTDYTEYRFKRKFKVPSFQITSAMGSENVGALQFALTDVPSYTEFTALFDQYQITGIKLDFYPRVTSVDSNAASYGDFAYVTDFDDAVPPSGLNELLQKQSCKVVHGTTKHFSLYFKPRAQLVAYNGTIMTPGFAQASSRQWVDCASAGVPYYGFKWVWTNVASSSTLLIDVIGTYYFKFKGVR